MIKSGRFHVDLSFLNRLNNCKIVTKQFLDEILTLRLFLDLNEQKTKIR